MTAPMNRSLHKNIFRGKLKSYLLLNLENDIDKYLIRERWFMSYSKSALKKLDKKVT